MQEQSARLCCTRVGQALHCMAPKPQPACLPTAPPRRRSWHCHIDLHAIAGMFMYLSVSEPGGTWYAPENLQCE